MKRIQKIKTSVSVPEKTNDMLDRLKYERKRSASSIMIWGTDVIYNHEPEEPEQVLDIYDLMTDSVKDDMFTFCIKRLLYLKRRQKEDSVNDFFSNSVKEDIAFYSKLAEFLNKESYEKSLDESFKNDIPAGMMRVDMENGYLICPDNWVVYEFEGNKPENCQYAHVVEVRNGSKYNLPHVVWFSNTKDSALTGDTLEELYASLNEVDPNFENAYEDRVEPTFDSMGNVTNSEKYLNAPTYGCFPIKDYDPDDPKVNYPLGAMVKRV